MQKTGGARVLAGVSLMALSTGGVAYAQESGGTSASARAVQDVVIVTARRREEDLQDVPLTVQAVGGDDLQELNIREFKDITAVVPGLAIEPDRTASKISLRGLRFDPYASGFAATVETYVNDVSVTSNSLVQASNFDVQQIEVLRGPQGTLRGKASPSGSITVTTRRPDLYEYGGYISTTATDLDGYNANGAVNIPLVEDHLALRVAGLWDQNRGVNVESIYNDLDSQRLTHAGRASLRFEPTDNLRFDLIYDDTVVRQRFYQQVESANIVDPTEPASAETIYATDRLAVSNVPEFNRLEYEIWNFQAEYRFAGQRLNYVYGHNEQSNISRALGDSGDFFGPAYPISLQTYATQDLRNFNTSDFHEVRLSSDERLFGKFDYVVGYFFNHNDPPTDLVNYTLLFFGPPSPFTPSTFTPTDISRFGEGEEKSFFGNLTYHLSDATEISGGVRYIDYWNDSNLAVSGNLLVNDHTEVDATVWQVSAKHRFSDNVMVYGSIGTSWRPGATAIGDFSLARSPLERQFLDTSPEESTSYEIGAKTTWLDGALTANATVFRQEFDNNPYRSVDGVFYVSTDFDRVSNSLVQSVKRFNFIADVPVEITGFELEAGLQATENWSISGNLAYAKSESNGAYIPCNDYFPNDGVPDSVGTVPTVADIYAVTGGAESLVACTVDQNASQSPDLSFNIQSEYKHPFGETKEGYIRGLLNYQGDADNVQGNPFDDYDAYSLFNLYLGIRDADGGWDLSLYAKNLFDAEEVISRGPTSIQTGYSILNFVNGVPVGATGYNGSGHYRAVGLTPEREFGITFRKSFGSR